MRLEELKGRVRKAYDDFEFHAIYHALNNFCSVDLSAVYLDILKDRLYTCRADSPLRRGSQTVLYEIITAMTKLMAPVLSFTAEEIWRSLAAQLPGGMETKSVHLAAFPEVESAWANKQLAKDWDAILDVRRDIQDQLEGLRQQKHIGSSLEAIINLDAKEDTYDLLKAYEKDLANIMIVSEVVLRNEPKLSRPYEISVEIAKEKYKKCERCWNYREAVGTHAAHPTLCDRCVEAVR